MTEGRIKNLTRALKGAPAATAGKALIAEAAWPGVEFPTAGAKTAAGTEAASNVAIFSESNIDSSSGNRKTFYRNRHYGKYRKNILFNPPPGIIRRAAVYE